MVRCRPLGFLIGLPFAFLSFLLSAVGAVVWLLGTLISCVCPCCTCFALLANLAVRLLKIPLVVMQCFIDLIPC
ncbi:unnamed protein product [Victoria cruziana]